MAVPHLAGNQINQVRVVILQTHKNPQRCILRFDSETQGEERPDSGISPA